LNRTEAAKEFDEIREQLAALMKRLSVIPQEFHFEADNLIDKVQDARKELLVRESKAARQPAVMEGFLKEEEDAVERLEDGTRYLIYHYLGCPDFRDNTATKRAWHYNHRPVRYSALKDVTDILTKNLNKFLRITIEELPLGEGENCGTCPDRFKCLTTMR